MLKKLLFSTLIIIGFLSCECSYQYTVYVRNNTGEELQVAYKTTNDIRGEVEETVTVPPGAFESIIVSVDLFDPEGCTGTKPEHCKMVAEYVNATLDSKPSKIEWCDEKINFIKSDIQQGEFEIIYTMEDF